MHSPQGVGLPRQRGRPETHSLLALTAKGVHRPWAGRSRSVRRCPFRALVTARRSGGQQAAVLFEVTSPWDFQSLVNPSQQTCSPAGGQDSPKDWPWALPVISKACCGK